MGTFFFSSGMRGVVYLVALLALCSVVLADCDSGDVKGGWACTGGRFNTLLFDDDEVEVSLAETQCTVFQDADYSIDDNDINLDFGSLLDFITDSCEIVGDEDECDCFEDDETFRINNDCDVIIGPYGETCVPTKNTEDCNRRQCPDGQTLIPNPDDPPEQNGCGASGSIIQAPSISFEDCCNEHDLCYSDCSDTKKNCDDRFYECMFCSCSKEYDFFVSEAICEELACTYYQAVDEFGCSAYEAAQENGCMCSGESKDSNRVYKEVPSKFGPGLSADYQSNNAERLICSEPFNAKCPNSSPGASSSASTLLPPLIALLFVFVF